MAFVLGRSFIRALQESLGLSDRAVRRLVLDVCIDRPCQLYVEELVHDENMAALLGELPKIRPEVLYTDRVHVENADGAEIVVKQVKCPDDELTRVLAAFAKHYASRSDEEKDAIRRAIGG